MNGQTRCFSGLARTALRANSVCARLLTYKIYYRIYDLMAWKLRLKPNGGTPLYRQIESSIRAAIGSGRLKAGDRIPSVADLATELKINRITVHKVFQRLEKAGLLRSEVGRGTFVAANGDGPPQAGSAGVGVGLNGEPVKPE